VNSGAAALRGLGCETGSSLAEFVISAGVTSLVSGIVVSGMLRLGDTENAIGNRTEMHAGIRGATELVQHEVSQAGRITLPGSVTLPAGAAAGTHVVSVSSAAGMFAGEQLVVDTGGNEETVATSNVDSANNTVTANFANAHAANVPVAVRGGFASGIVPPSMANGSTGKIL